eukprot:TRINITY_DN14254_c0_g1_i1.p2 TRINITY_DN14254_c0_g1~~TRINITY_DN14254_c0_g1_i1.p2  ORF type:complete len:234 (+),score=39.48 TRINITY_DN14254_c0_g1_i1:92-703(+)
MARTESSEDRRARRARMEVTLDNWLIKYSSTADALGFQIADASHIAYDNITAAQNEENYRRRAQGATHVWLVSVRGHVVRPGVFFEGRFTLKYEPVDGEFRIRKEHFAVTEQANPLPVTMGRPDEPFGLEFSVQGGIVTADQVQSGPRPAPGLPHRVFRRQAGQRPVQHARRHNGRPRAPGHTVHGGVAAAEPVPWAHGAAAP